MAKAISLYNLDYYITGRIFLMILLFFSLPVFSQEDIIDTTEINSAEIQEIENDSVYHSPRKAAIYSAALPGLGQIYNRRYWKVPLVYIGFGTFYYFIEFNNKRFKEFKQAFKDFPDYKLNYPYKLTSEQIERATIYYKRWRDLSILGTLGFYVFQILDATVDAHLFNWEVGEDLTFNIKPSLIFPPSNNGLNSLGFSACLSF